MMETLEETFAHMLDEDSEIVTIYVGEDGSEDLANELAQSLAEKYEDVEVESTKVANQSTHTCLV